MTIGEAKNLTRSDLDRMGEVVGYKTRFNDDGTLAYATLNNTETVRNIDLSQEGLGTQGDARRQFQKYMADRYGENVRTSDIDVDSNGITRWYDNGDKDFFSVSGKKTTETYIEPSTRHGNTLNDKVYVRKTDKGYSDFSFNYEGSKKY